MSGSASMRLEAVPVAASTSQEQTSERFKEIARHRDNGRLDKPGIDRTLRDHKGVRDPTGLPNRQSLPAEDATGSPWVERLFRAAA